MNDSDAVRLAKEFLEDWLNQILHDPEHGEEIAKKLLRDECHIVIGKRGAAVRPTPAPLPEKT